MFENLIILLILMNSIVLAIYDYNDRDNELVYNQRLELIGQVFTVLFSIEMVLKILAQGFILHYNAYLRDAWNWLDFIVVITGTMEMMHFSNIEVRSLRFLRILRPLRSIKASPKMRRLVSSLVGSVNSLLNVVIFMMFIFTLFGILGTQQFKGTMYNRCRFSEEPLADGTWPIDKEIDNLCSPDGYGLMDCPADRFCKQPDDAGLSASIDDPLNNEMILYNVIGFDNLGWAMLTIFQMITLEHWTTVMYLLMDSNIWWMAVIFCVSLILIGSFFLLNVILAVLADALNMVEQVQFRQDNERLKKIQRSLDRAENQKIKKNGHQYEYQDKDEDEPSDVSDYKLKRQNLRKFIVSSSKDCKDDFKNLGALQLIHQLQPLELDAGFEDPEGNQNRDKELAVGGQIQQTADMSTEKPKIIFTDRNGKSRIYYVCFRICTHWTFIYFITALIFANTVLLALERYPDDPKTTEIATILNELFTWAFLFEMVIKLIGLGFRGYARDSFNIFDALVVILSLVELTMVTVLTDTPSTAVSAFRGVRLLRIFKMARSWTGLREILVKMLVTFKDVNIFSLLLFLFMIIFSLLGMELFGFRLLFYDDLAKKPDDPNFDKALSPRPNFDNLGMSITTIFAIAIGDDWNYLMAMAYRAEGFIAIFFYPIVFVFMNLVLLNLFLAILLQNFGTRELSERDSKEDKNVVKFKRHVKKFVRRFNCCHVDEENEKNLDMNVSGIEFKFGQNSNYDPFNRKESSSSSNNEAFKEDFQIESLEAQNDDEMVFQTIKVENTSKSAATDRNEEIPGNQQGSGDRSASVSGDSFNENKVFRSISPYVRRNSSELQTRQIINKISSEIPDEYNPTNLRKLYQRPRMRFMNFETKHFKSLEQTQKMLANTKSKMSIVQLKKKELIDKQESYKRAIKMIGRSLFCFSKTNCLRKVCYQIVKHAWYDSAILTLIAISTLLLSLDNPNMDENGALHQVLGILDYVLTTLFTIECLINIILFGLICNGKASYIRDPWNIMDLLIVTFSILTIILDGEGRDDLSILKIFRLLRVLRPLRFLKRNLGLKIQAISLLKSIPGIGNLLLIAGLILMIFGIQAVSLLKGTFYYCDTYNVPPYAVPEINTKWDCLDYGGDWLNQEGNFDNVLNAMVTMFGMMTTEGWLEIMWSAVDSTKIHQVPQRNNKLPFIAFFSLFMIIGSLFILNLFVGVVINTFNIEKEKLSHNSQMTDLQDEYCEVLIKCYQLKPLKVAVQTGNKCRDAMLKIVQHQAFEIFIFVCICLNTVVLAMHWYGMDQQIIDVLEILNYIFTLIYTIEMVIKLVAFGKRYFKDSWCLFDFFIVVSALIGIILQAAGHMHIGSMTTILRSFRIARVLKIIKTAKNLQHIFHTFILAIPELINVGALLILFLFLFSVLGVSLFSEVKLQEKMNRQASFENFTQALLTLLRVSTGEDWVGIMQDAARSPSILFNCIEKQSYESKVKDGIQGCGNSASYVYFVAFILIVSLVFLNLFIAIILEGFAASASEEKVRISDESFVAFQRAWQKYDPQGTQMISPDKVENLIQDLIQEELEMINKDKHLKSVNFNLNQFKIIMYCTKWMRNLHDEEDRKGYFKEIEKNKRRQAGLRRQMRSFISDLKIPLYDGMKKVQFHDTLNGIISTIYQRSHKKFVVDRLSRIKTKIKVGERLQGWEPMVVGCEQFWELAPRDQEEFIQRTEPQFQNVVNRLENKGNELGQVILKLDQMRRLRRKAGASFSSRMFFYQGENEEQQVFDTSHFIAGKIILKRMLRSRKQSPRRSGLTKQSSYQKLKIEPITLNNISSDHKVIERSPRSTLKDKFSKPDERKVSQVIDDKRLITIVESHEHNETTEKVMMHFQNQLHEPTFTCTSPAELAAPFQSEVEQQQPTFDHNETPESHREESIVSFEAKVLLLEKSQTNSSKNAHDYSERISSSGSQRQNVELPRSVQDAAAISFQNLVDLDRAEQFLSSGNCIQKQESEMITKHGIDELVVDVKQTRSKSTIPETHSISDMQQTQLRLTRPDQKHSVQKKKTILKKVINQDQQLDDGYPQTPAKKQVTVNEQEGEQHSQRRVQLLRMASNLLEVDAKERANMMMNKIQIRLPNIDEEDFQPSIAKLPETSNGIRKSSFQPLVSDSKINDESLQHQTSKRPKTNSASIAKHQNSQPINIEPSQSPALLQIGQPTVQSPHAREMMWYLDQDHSERVSMDNKMYQPKKNTFEIKPRSRESKELLRWSQEDYSHSNMTPPICRNENIYQPQKRSNSVLPPKKIPLQLLHEKKQQQKFSNESSLRAQELSHTEPMGHTHEIQPSANITQFSTPRMRIATLLQQIDQKKQFENRDRSPYKSKLAIEVQNDQFTPQLRHKSVSLQKKRQLLDAYKLI